MSVPYGKYCPNCKALIAFAARTCDVCGIILPSKAVTNYAPERESQADLPPEDAPARYLNRTGFERITVGLSPSDAGINRGFAILGIALCLSGVGLVFGIPLLLVIYAESKKKRDVLRGPCPYCNAALDVRTDIQSVHCPFCRKRILIRGAYFYAM